MVALSVALLGVTGCGGSSDAPPAAAPGAPAAAPADAGTATPVADTGGGAVNGGDGSIVRDIEAQRKASKAALRKWGKAANRVCRKGEQRLERNWVGRIKAMVPKGRKPTKREVERMGAVILAMSRDAERTYDSLQGIALPTEPDAVDTILAFFDKVEEELVLAQRIGIELEKRNDLESIVHTLVRVGRLADDFKRSSKSVHAPSCA